MAKRTVDNHYLSLLLPAFRKYSEQLVFRPYIGRDDAWESITYRQLEERLAAAQAHWRTIFAPLELKPLDVVGFWLTGRKVSDLINSIAVSSLGYTPQFFGGYFNNAAVVLELIAKSGGKALVADPVHMPNVTAASSSVPAFTSLEFSEISQLVADAVANGKQAELTFAPVAAVGMDDLAVLFHSSGTTGSLPKIIPNTYKMLHAVIKQKWPNAQVPREQPGQGVVNTLGNLAHIGSFHIFLGSIAMGMCVAQSSSMAMQPREFVNMTRECGLNVVVLYATFLSDLIRAARTDDAVKDALKAMNQIIHTGVALNKEDEEWAYANGVRITTSYGTTETGPMMRSGVGSDPASRLLRPIGGANPEFRPHGDQNNIRGSVGAELYEMVVAPTSDDCPPREFLSEDGYYHTNDLFEKVDDGWVYRGRAGDWIKLLNGFCDTKTAEDNVRKACADIIHDAVMVGTGRTLPAFVVEVDSKGTPLSADQKASIAQTVVERIADYNTRVFGHERVDDPKRVLVVEKGTLPRTKEKGNVRRAATEELFAKELDLVAPY